MHRSTNRAGRNHIGSGSHHDRPDHDAAVGYELMGSVRWLDLDLQRVVLHVDASGAHGGAFVGTDATVDLADCAIHGASLEELWEAHPDHDAPPQPVAIEL